MCIACFVLLALLQSVGALSPWEKGSTSRVHTKCGAYCILLEGRHVNVCLEVVLELVNVNLLRLPSFWGDGDQVVAHSDSLNHFGFPSGAGACLRAEGCALGGRRIFPGWVCWGAGLYSAACCVLAVWLVPGAWATLPGFRVNHEPGSSGGLSCSTQ